MRSEYELNYPEKIIFGNGCLFELKGVIGAINDMAGKERVFLVSGGHFTRSGVFQDLVSSLDNDFVGVCDSVRHDPTIQSVEGIVEMIRESGATVVVAIGGGSVIDAGKAAAILATSPRLGREYFHGEKKLVSNGLPFVAIPTTAGTGAELTNNAVLSDYDTGEKKSLRAANMVARVAIVDPQLTLTMPASLTATTGLDALTQAIESYISLKSTAVTQALAGKAVGLLMGNLLCAYEAGGDLDVRVRVAEGSLLSALSFSQGGLGAVHGLAHPIGLALGLEHGITCAILLPYILEWNSKVCGERFVELAKVINLSTIQEFIDAVIGLCRSLGIPSDFTDYKLGTEQLLHIIKHCRSGSMQANPRYMSDTDIMNLLKKIFTV